MNLSLSKLLLVIAIICFVLAAFGVGITGVSIGWIGLAFFAAAGLL